ncbi:MAG TPA: efflux RND transporter permease subunit [Gemmataceae bacterium]|nr:efflux RND transporter permease subunit [Gemmataceae bacterium]
MLSRFFIDRPIFATVVSAVIVLAGLVAYSALPVAQYPEVAPPTVQVTASYPGANALTVRDTVAAPIEEQVSGVEGMLYMSSTSTNDGTYSLTVTFKAGMDSDMAQVLVQNRVSLALPVIPPLVQNEGITVRKMSPSTLMIVNLVSPDNSHDATFLSNYATIYVKDELGRLDGVAGITYLGQRDYSLRAWLDPDRLAALKLGAMDVVTAIAEQNIQVAAGQIGQPPASRAQQFQLTINTRGRLTQPEEFAAIVVKAAQVNPTVQSSTSGSSDQTGSSPQGGSSSAGTATGANGSTPPATGIVYLRDVVTHTPDGQPRIELGSQQYDQICTLDRHPSVALSIYQLPGSNALSTADRVRAKMQELKIGFPEGIDYQIVYDTTPFIRESIAEVRRTLVVAVILVAIVVLFFLQDWKAMILPMIDVPVSLIGTFAVMAALGFTLNNLTLFGLVLAIGIVVDDAIVVLENIERQMAKGLEVRTATIKAMEEITGPVLAITLVLSAVFIPCCFLGGVSGQFFRQFAVTIAASTIISAINALTMTPSRAVLIFKTEQTAAGHEHRREALPWWIFGVVGGWLTFTFGPAFLSTEYSILSTERSSWLVSAAWFIPGALVGGVLGWLLIRPINAALGWVFRGFNRLFDRVTAFYGRTVAGVLRVSVVALVFYGGLLVLTGWQFARAPTGFIPQQDKGYLILNVQLPDAAAVDRTQRILDRVERVALDTPGVEHTLGVAGRSLILNANAPNLASMYVILKEFSARERGGLSADAIAARLQERCQKEVRGGLVTTFGGPPVEGLGTTAGFKLIVEDRGGLGQDELQRATEQLVSRGNRTPGLVGLFSGSRASTPWLYLDIDRTKCMALGIPVSEVFNTLQVYLGSYYVNNFNSFGRTWQVVVQADQEFRDRVADIRKLQVKTNQGQMVRLGTLLDVHDTSGPVMLLRYNLYSAAAVTGNPGPNTSSGRAITLVQQVADQALPRSMAYDWTELTYLQLQAGNTALAAFALAVVFVFLVLAALYESWSLPLAVILVVPMCLLCSIGGVELAGSEVTIFTEIGFVVLVGLACKNAILIVEFAKQLQETGVSRREAVLEASRLRLRPIVMTSFAFILGVVPLVLAIGAGAEMRQALGLAVFSGMLGVTLFGIFLTPVFYDVIRRFDERQAPVSR